MKLVLSVEQELLIIYCTSVARSVIVPQFNWYRSIGVFIHSWFFKLFDLFIVVLYVFIVMAVAVSLENTLATPR